MITIGVQTVDLIVDDKTSISILEYLLYTNNIKYNTYKVSDINYKLDTPFLIIDGVPLDHTRSLKWVTEYKKGVVK